MQHGGTLQHKMRAARFVKRVENMFPKWIVNEIACMPKSLFFKRLICSKPLNLCSIFEWRPRESKVTFNPEPVPHGEPSSPSSSKHPSKSILKKRHLDPAEPSVAVAKPANAEPRVAVSEPAEAEPPVASSSSSRPASTRIAIPEFPETFENDFEAWSD